MWYIASMYSLDTKSDSEVDKQRRKKRYEYVRDKTAELYRQGNMVYSPIVHCYDMANSNNLPSTYSFWQETDRHMIDISEGVIVLCMESFNGKTWEDSEGMSDEITYAKQIGKPVVFLNAEDYNDCIKTRTKCWRNTKSFRMDDGSYANFEVGMSYKEHKRGDDIYLVDDTGEEHYFPIDNSDNSVTNWFACCMEEEYV